MTVHAWHSHSSYDATLPSETPGVLDSPGELSACVLFDFDAGVAKLAFLFTVPFETFVAGLGVLGTKPSNLCAVRYYYSTIIDIHTSRRRLNLQPLLELRPQLSCPIVARMFWSVPLSQVSLAGLS